MTAESPAQTVQRLFPPLADGKSAEAAALFADSVSFSIPHPPGIPWVRDIDTAFALHTTVRDGRITRYHLYEDSYAVAKAYFDD
ncbi:MULTISPECIES: hypothetical protein [unclassified Streptomyces]|uniref:SnoaL-like domain-containing protein n=1 Tax=Streptomyces sp. NBC_00119 TaxID=2975659 RepID=A0AAU1UKL1_9ACTN|nr:MULTISPECIES: hypothetical protein [unclassified Streptomyces]MCX4649881.1 hypothetical protein [Streptomyces sp. NBC_01446]MCX5320906.1 hypothetical protein [Streptomyces sp. NBC_00120]